VFKQAQGIVCRDDISVSTAQSECPGKARNLLSFTVLIRYSDEPVVCKAVNARLLPDVSELISAKIVLIPALRVGHGGANFDYCRPSPAMAGTREFVETSFAPLKILRRMAIQMQW